MAEIFQLSVIPMVRKLLNVQQSSEYLIPMQENNSLKLSQMST
jgi:hypothetical protein